jgi:hypothetical protein
MKKIIGMMILASVTVSASHAQYAKNGYTSAIGIRLGDGYYDLVSASLKTFISDAGAVEFNIGFRNYGIPGYSWFNLSGSASYQYHFDIQAVDGLKWFIGGGATVFNTFSSSSSYRGFGVGVFPTGGVDYKFAEIPLNVSADFRPTISIVKPYSYYNDFYIGNFGISARYTFR